MKKLFIFLVIISFTIPAYAKSNIIDTTGGNALAAMGVTVTKNDKGQVVEYGDVTSYPVMFKKGSDYFCYTGENLQFQLYGWQQVDTLGTGQIEWRYFDKDSGKLVTNAWTLDGYYLGPNGAIVPEAGNARDYNTEGFKFGTTTDEMHYRFANGQMAVGDWYPISPLKNCIYYWYYFDYSGNLVKNSNDVMGKYRVNKDGQYMENNEVVCFDVYPGQQIDMSKKPVYSDDSQQSYQIVYSNDGKNTILGATPIEGAIIYAVGNTGKQTRFINQIEKDNASNCDFDLEDRNFYDEYAEDNMAVMKQAILMKGSKASFKIKCNKYNVYKFKYAIEYGNGAPGSNEDYFAQLDFYIDGELCYNDDEVYTNNKVVGEMEVISEYKKDILVVFTSSNSNLDLILTVDSMKKDNSYMEDNDED